MFPMMIHKSVAYPAILFLERDGSITRPLPFGIAGCFLFLLLWATPSLAVQPLVIGGADSYHLGGAAVEVLEDPGRGLTIDDVVSPRYAARFIPSRLNVPNFGMTDSAFWLRFTVAAGHHGGEPWLLLLEQPLMNLVDLYVPRGDGGFDVKRSGDHIPMSRRNIREREIVLPLPLGTAPRTFYLRTWIAGRAQMPLTVLTRKAFQQRKASQNFFFGAYAGFMLVMMLLGVALYTLLRDRNYLLYVFYAAAILLMHFNMNGYLYAYVFPGHPLLHEYTLIQLGTLTILSGLLFARRFLRLSEYAPRLHRVVGWHLRLNLLMVLFCHLIPVLLYKKLVNFNMLAATMMALVAACISYRKGFIPARYYAYGRLSLAVCGFVYPLANEGFFPVNWFTKNSLLLASVGDILFIMLAMGHHFYVMSRQVGTLVVDLAREVEERTSANLALHDQMEERKRLEREIQRVSREERRRISHELHDGLCQQLTGARLRFAALEDRLADAGMQTEAKPLGSLLQNSVDHAYALSRRLWSSDGAGSEGAIDLEELARSLSAQSNIPIFFKLNRNCQACSFAGMPHIHLIAREALVNAVKHSGATRIDVSLHCTAGDTLRLEVRDNGCGIAVTKGRGGGLGVGMMEYRAATIGARLEITDAQGRGMAVVCTVPCNVAPVEEVANV